VASEEMMGVNLAPAMSVLLKWSASNKFKIVVRALEEPSSGVVAPD
jgi:hypothetical protein